MLLILAIVVNDMAESRTLFTCKIVKQYLCSVKMRKIDFKEGLVSLRLELGMPLLGKLEYRKPI